MQGSFYSRPSMVPGQHKKSRGGARYAACPSNPGLVYV
jgi:hypothetical protein